MPRPYVTAAEHRRKANRITALLILIIVTPTRVRLRSPMARTIPGHRLVEDVDA
jgi:hypothetical protein